MPARWPDFHISADKTRPLTQPPSSLDIKGRIGRAVTLGQRPEEQLGRNDNPWDVHGLQWVDIPCRQNYRATAAKVSGTRDILELISVPGGTGTLRVGEGDGWGEERAGGKLVM